MAKRYAIQTWVNRPSTASPVDAARLNHIETGIDDVDNAIETINNTSLPDKVDKTSIATTDTVNDTTKVLGANVGYALGQEIDTINNKLNVHKTGVLITSDTSGLSVYPTVPGIYRVINPAITGLPVSIVGYGCLVIFDCGSYIMHQYIDANNTMYFSRTDAASSFKPSTWNKPTANTVSSQ